MKLTAKKRARVTQWGLPDENNGKGAYPLNDKRHVRSAIQMFKHCLASKKRTLANNIKKRLKELNMTVEISPDSAFYPYAGPYKKK